MPARVGRQHEATNPWPSVAPACWKHRRQHHRVGCRFVPDGGTLGEGGTPEERRGEPKASSEILTSSFLSVSRRCESIFSVSPLAPHPASPSTLFVPTKETLTRMASAFLQASPCLATLPTTTISLPPAVSSAPTPFFSLLPLPPRCFRLFQLPAPPRSL